MSRMGSLNSEEIQQQKENTRFTTLKAVFMVDTTPTMMSKQHLMSDDISQIPNSYLFSETLVQINTYLL